MAAAKPLVVSWSFPSPSCSAVHRRDFWSAPKRGSEKKGTPGPPPKMAESHSVFFQDFLCFFFAQICFAKKKGWRYKRATHFFHNSFKTVFHAQKPYKAMKNESPSNFVCNFCQVSPPQQKQELLIFFPKVLSEGYPCHDAKMEKKTPTEFWDPFRPSSAAAILSLRSGEVPIGSEVWDAQNCFADEHGRGMFWKSSSPEERRSFYHQGSG